MINRVTDLGHSRGLCKFLRMRISHITELQQIIRTDMFQKKMKSLTMIMMTKMTQLVQKNIIPQRSRKPYYIKVEIDVVSCGTTAPVRGIMLDGNPVI